MFHIMRTAQKNTYNNNNNGTNKTQLKTALNCSRARLQLQFPAKWAATIENILLN